MDETSLQPLASDSTDPGELWISGDTVFREYLGKEQATREAFSEDATGRQWFRTGDVAQRVRVPGSGERDGKGEWYYRILGRQSSDIIKVAGDWARCELRTLTRVMPSCFQTGGYKVSALEIERELLQHPAVVEVAVVGVPDSDDAQANNTGIWGERIAAIVVEAEPISHAIHAPSTTVTTTTTLRDWLRPRLASYKIPSYVYHMRALPRNHMGKLNKKQLVQMLKDGMIK